MNSLKPSFSLTNLIPSSSSSFSNSNPSLLSLHRRPFPPSKQRLLLNKPIFYASLIPSNQPQQQQQLYQPFRPPPSPIPPQFRSLDAPARLEILRNKLGRWFEYAPLIPSLYQEGFSIPFIEETTGIAGAEQNRLVVAAQVRDSLIQSNTDPQIIDSFDTGGSEVLLYEIRLLSASQRAAAAQYLVERGFDGKGAQDLARAMKDFPRRRGDDGWEYFDYNLPGDCLSFLLYRQGREHKNPSEQRASSLKQALDAAQSERAKSEIVRELEGGVRGNDGKEEVAVRRIPVVRLKVGEVAGATSVVVLPVCRAEEKEKEILEAPWKSRSEGVFSVVVAEDKGWNRWVVLPGWEPVVGLGKGGVVVAFSDARALPWKVNNRWYKEEPILVLADRGTTEVEVDDGFYLVAVDDGVGLKVERGSALKERGVKESLGNVVMVVRPPKEETDDQLSDEDWE